MQFIKQKRDFNVYFVCLSVTTCVCLLLFQDVKPYTSFVKIVKTASNPLVLVFRLSHRNAAKKLWDYFENGKLNTMITKCLSNFEATKDLFKTANLKIEIQIKDEYEKVLKTFNDSERKSFFLIIVLPYFS